MVDSQFPLIDLHRHLEGNVRIETILDIARQNNIPLPEWEVEKLLPYVQVTSPQPGVMSFIEKFDLAMSVLVNENACFRIAYENVEDALIEGIDYLELRFSPFFMSQKHNIDLVGVVDAVCSGVEAGINDFDINVNIIGIISRTYGVIAGTRELEALLTQRDRIVALDLAGDEEKFPGELFEEHFKKARDNGWQITIHAGESAGPESIWQALQGLGANRIGHGVSAISDKKLMDTMLQRGTGIEVSLTSNVQTSTVGSYSSHPIRHFLDLGLLATINTDDPAISGIDLHYEYQVAAPAAGLTNQQILQAQRNALSVSFLTSTEKESLRKRSTDSHLSKI